MCEYCDGSKKPIETEVDGDAYMTVMVDDPEYPEGFLLDVYSMCTDADGGYPLTFSFIVPRCPICGRGTKEVLG